MNRTPISVSDFRLCGCFARLRRFWGSTFALSKGGFAGIGKEGRSPYLSPHQISMLCDRASEDGFFTIHEAVEWVWRHFGVRYTYWGMRSLFRRLGFIKKTPRPVSSKASLQAQQYWKKGV